MITHDIKVNFEVAVKDVPHIPKGYVERVLSEEIGKALRNQRYISITATEQNKSVIYEATVKIVVEEE